MGAEAVREVLLTDAAAIAELDPMHMHEHMFRNMWSGQRLPAR